MSQSSRVITSQACKPSIKKRIAVTGLGTHSCVVSMSSSHACAIEYSVGMSFLASVIMLVMGIQRASLLYELY